MDAILFRAVWTIKPGKLEDVKRAAREFADALARKQPGTRFAGLHITPDGKRLIVHEIHKDPAATLAHVTGSVVPEFMPKFAALADGPAFEVYGKLTPELEGMLKGFNPAMHAPAAGFLR